MNGFLEGVTTRGHGRLRSLGLIVDCNKCVSLDETRLCQRPELIDPVFGPHKVKRTADYCRYFKPKEEAPS